MTADPPTYPEHEKLAAVAGESQVIGEFLDSHDHPYVLAEWVRVYEDEQGNLRELAESRLIPAQKSIQQILADYFDINLQKIESEKRQMLSALAARHAPKD